jgi:cellular nucleic acid-binding protein
MPTVYVLLCEKGRYYVGKTDRPLHSRVEEHFNKEGSEWTRKYNPIKVVDQIHDADEFDEDKYTKMYMKKYGIDKVRGGTYTQIYLPDYSIRTLEKEICSASDSCFRCNRSGHFASQCFASTKVDGSPIEHSDDDTSECWCCEYCDSEFATEREAIKHEKTCNRSCFRCGRSGHYVDDCYASSHINGKRLY